MGKWECQVCGYIYDEEKGEEETGIPTATPFSELPEDWVCPQCGIGKNFFDKVEE